MRNERIIKSPPVDVKKMKKNDSGSFDFRNDGNIGIVRWNEGSVATIGSSAYGVLPRRSAKIWIKERETK